MYNALATRILAASLLALAGSLTLAGSASAACGPRYKPVRWQNSGNIVCVLDVAAGNNTLAAPTAGPGPVGQIQRRHKRLKRAARRRH